MEQVSVGKEQPFAVRRFDAAMTGVRLAAPARRRPLQRNDRGAMRARDLAGGVG